MSMEDQMEKDEFIARFKAELQRLLPDGAYDAGYVDRIAPTYWEDDGLRADGPEECAESEAHEWGAE
jgi:hypothetical protein